MKQRTIYIGLFLVFIIGIISLIGTFAIDSTITEGNSSKADYLFNITLGDRTNRQIVIPSYDSKIVDIKISNPNEFNMSYLFYLEGTNSNISAINISDTDARGILTSTGTDLIKVFIQNNSGTDITTNIRDIVGFETETLDLPSNSTAINKGPYYKAIVKSNNNDYGKVKPNIKLSVNAGTVKYTIVPNDGYQYKSTTCEGTIVDNILTISNITSNVNCEVVFEPIQVTVNLDLGGGVIETTYTEPQEYTYIAPSTGNYKLETWGAQGGQYSTTAIGYGGYSTGNVSLKKGDILYINVGGQGESASAESTFTTGGYNGGGNANYSAGTGGGATHIATKSGLLSSLSSDLSSILIVAGGGGGTGVFGTNESGGSGGGINGNAGGHYSSTYKGGGGGGTQTAGGSLGSKSVAVTGTIGQFGTGGQGGYQANYKHGSGGGGGGLYGGAGGSARNGGGGGGSGYIGNSLLTDKYMYCYNCTTSDVESTKTYTTTNVSDTPTSDYTKSGNGAVKITIMNDVILNMAYNDKYGTLPTPTRDGYTFDGWYTEPDGKGTKITDSTTLTNNKNHTLYASWTPRVEYTMPGSYTYTIPRTGLYKLETWGAQGGGTTGGYGGYSTGNIAVEEGTILYLNVGGKGTSTTGGYNGGGNASGSTTNIYGGAGGGATHIAVSSGMLSTLTDKTADILIVSGGGGGAAGWVGNHTVYSDGGSAGGYTGNSGIAGKNSVSSGKYTEPGGGTQTAGGTAAVGTEVSGKAGSFGQGADSGNRMYGGGGGGYYGGGGGGGSYYISLSGGGGSGYIGNSLLTDKYMYCYNCTTSDEESTKTYTTTNVSDTPTSDYAKGGDGAIKITFMGADIKPPTGTMTTSKEYNIINASIDATDNFGIDHYEYYLSTSSTCPTAGYTTSSSNTHSFVIKKTGTYYVCAKVVDGNNNTLSLKSDAIEITRIYSAAVRYNVNGGTISPSTGTYTWTTDSTGLIYRNGSIYEQTIYYGEPADLADYNNSNFINIDPGDLHVPSGGEWICLSGCSTANKVFNQATKYNVSDFCDVTNANCTVVVGLRLVSDTTKPTCSLSANASTITATASDDMGISYQGWDSSYSGTNETSKVITAGTHTYYVKDTSGNTNTCSIDIATTQSKSNTSYDWTSASKSYVGSCYCCKGQGSSTVGSYVNCNSSTGTCSCPSGTSICKSTCTAKYSCTHGEVVGTQCRLTYTSIEYYCDTGYVKINDSWCYK